MGVIALFMSINKIIPFPHSFSAPAAFFGPRNLISKKSIPHQIQKTSDSLRRFWGGLKMKSSSRAPIFIELDVELGKQGPVAPVIPTALGEQQHINISTYPLTHINPNCTLHVYVNIYIQYIICKYTIYIYIYNYTYT
jgi:hypothetical protein